MTNTSNSKLEHFAFFTSSYDPSTDTSISDEDFYKEKRFGFHVYRNDENKFVACRCVRIAPNDALYKDSSEYSKAFTQAIADKQTGDVPHKADVVGVTVKDIGEMFPVVLTYEYIKYVECDWEVLREVTTKAEADMYGDMAKKLFEGTGYVVQVLRHDDGYDICRVKANKKGAVKTRNVNFANRYSMYEDILPIDEDGYKRNTLVRSMSAY